MPQDNPRILQLLPALGDGGVERSAIEMAEYLGGLGLTNFIASAGGPLVSMAEAAGSRHVTIPVGRKSPVAMLSAARAVARLIDAESIDLIHARSRAPAWVGLMARRFARRPVRFLTTFHGVYSHGNALKRFYNGAMLRTPVVIANSQFIRHHIVDVYGYPNAQILVAPRGIDPSVFDRAAVPEDLRLRLRAEFGAAAGAPLIVMASRITGWKGHSVFLDALARSGRPDIRAAFVGSGTDSTIADLKQQVGRLGLNGRIIFAGSRRDIPAVLAAADLVVSASIRPEAFGRAAIEAQAMETPVIATSHGGSLETILPGVTGWLVEPGNPDAMAAAIGEAFADPTRLADMGPRGRQHVLANFTTKQMLDAEFSAYRRILGEPA